MDDSLSPEERIAAGDYDLFAAVVAHGSLAAAGRALGISAPMVSKRMARLERRLGTRLIHRTTRRMALTEAGRRFHQDVLTILAAVAAAERTASGQPGRPRGPLRLSAPTSFGRLHVAPHLGRFVESYPDIELTLDLSDAFSDLIADRIDLAVRITAQVPPQLAARRLGTSRRILCASPAYLARHGVPADVAALPRHRLLAATGQLPWRLIGPDGPTLVDGIPAVRTNSSEVVRELAVAGAGIALRSLWDVTRDLAAGRLARVLPDHEGSADVGIYAVHQRTPLPSPNVAAMIDYLAGLYDPPPPWAV
ncbi:LysR family transcriptional regulator [Sphingomonas profundi]|uniref:LysR family transcriptional regulator n=1 Tax=Alterirhizorhabdus profundi TaxID=2681549 RepID=UPI0018D1ED81|nr:LysR family transcriptional regulator [Sphingomonas profundi]